MASSVVMPMPRTFLQLPRPLSSTLEATNACGSNPGRGVTLPLPPLQVEAETVLAVHPWSRFAGTQPHQPFQRSLLQSDRRVSMALEYLISLTHTSVDDQPKQPVTLGERPPSQLPPVGDRSLMWVCHITGTPKYRTPLCSSLNIRADCRGHDLYNIAIDRLHLAARLAESEIRHCRNSLLVIKMHNLLLPFNFERFSSAPAPSVRGQPFSHPECRRDVQF